MWDKKKPELQQAAAPEAKNLPTDRESAGAMRPLDAAAN